MPTKEEIIDEFRRIREQFRNDTGSYDITREYYIDHSQFGYRYRNFDLTFSGLKNYRYFNNHQTPINKHKKIKRYLVSAIVPRAENNKKFINAMLRYCKDENAELILVNIKGVHNEYSFDDETLRDYGQYFKYDFKFNNAASIINPNLTANNNLSLPSIARQIPNDKTYIIPCVRQKMEMLPRVGRENETNDIHYLYTTGTVSEPIFKNNQTGYFNAENLTLGGLVVEVDDDRYCNIRNIRWINNCFVDLKKMYCFDNTFSVRPDALVAGDFHIGGDEDKQALQITKEQLLYLQPKMLVVHDLASHNTINHHIAENYMTRAKQLQEANLHTLEDEHRYIAKFISEYSKDILDIEWKIVASNHNDWLKQYLDSRRSWGDIHNDAYNTRLKQNFYEKDIDVFEAAIRYQLTQIKADKRIKLKFLSRKDNLLVGGYELALHGDKGNMGGKGSLSSHELSAKKCVIGHSHSPKIGTYGFQVGTNSKLELNYTAGSGNNWAHANCAVYDKLGQVQMILTINGRWK